MLRWNNRKAGVLLWRSSQSCECQTCSAVYYLCRFVYVFDGEGTVMTIKPLSFNVLTFTSFHQNTFEDFTLRVISVCREGNFY